jgi:hypothetical protein
MPSRIRSNPTAITDIPAILVACIRGPVSAFSRLNMPPVKTLVSQRSCPDRGQSGRQPGPADKRWHALPWFEPHRTGPLGPSQKAQAALRPALLIRCADGAIPLSAGVAAIQHGNRSPAHPRDQGI